MKSLVKKELNRFRICGDFKVTINQVAEIESYPLPRVEELLATMSGGKLFTKLDLSQAYVQIELEEESKKCVTVNTHQGLFNLIDCLLVYHLHRQVSKGCMENLFRG